MELTVTLGIPGAPPRSFVRTLCDRTGPAGRSKASDPGGIPAELGDVHALVISVGQADLASFLAAARGLPSFLGEVLRAKDDPVGSPLPIAYELWPLSLAARTLDVLATHRAAPIAESGVRVRLYNDAPRVIVVSQGLRPGAGGGVEAGLVTDLLADDLRLVVPAGEPAGIAASRRILYGALEGAYEAAFTAGALQPGKDPRRRAGSAAAIAEDALRRIAAGDLASIAPSPADEAFLRQASEAGDLIFGSPGSKGVWWQVEPATGRARAVLAPSLGGSYAYAAGEVLREAARGMAGGGAGESVGARTTWHIRQLADGRILSASEADIAEARAARLAAGRFGRPGAAAPRRGEGT